MEGLTEKDKLITALKVSGLRAILWNTRMFLYEIESDDSEYIFRLELAKAIYAINDVIHKCDDYLNNYVRNYKGE